MSITVSCDVCGESGVVVWGTFSYSPGGGRHGVEEFHFCHKCVFEVRAHVLSVSPTKHGDPRWMICEDVEEGKR